MNQNAKIAKCHAKSARKTFAFLCECLCVLCGLRKRFVAGRVRQIGALLFTAYCLLLTSACRRDMQDQPKAIAYRESTFFRDGLSSRPLVPGTVARGYLRADREFYFGKKANSAAVTAGQPASTGSPTTSGPP